MMIARSQQPAVSARGRMCLVAFVCWIITGCSGPAQTPGPTTYPVTGIVLRKDGRPFPGGTIQFVSKSDPTLTITGDIREDGTFEVYTLFQGKKLPGAVAGPCQVLVSPRFTENKPVAIYQPPQLFTVAAEANSFVINVESAPNKG